MLVKWCSGIFMNQPVAHSGFKRKASLVLIDRFGNPTGAVLTDGTETGQVAWGDEIADSWFSGRSTATFSIWMKPLEQTAGDSMIFAEYSRLLNPVPSLFAFAAYN